MSQYLVVVYESRESHYDTKLWLKTPKSWELTTDKTEAHVFEDHNAAFRAAFYFAPEAYAPHWGVEKP